MSKMDWMKNDIDRVLVSEEELNSRLDELAAKITEDYKGKDLVMICVLKGSVVFFSELFKRINMPVACDFISTTSYGNSTKSSGVVRLLKDADSPVQGKHVLFVEDIIDSGLTLSYLSRNFADRGAASVKIITLLDKPARRKVDLKPDYCGFVIPDEFVVGYGLDYDEKYRNLPEVCVLKKEVYQ